MAPTEIRLLNSANLEMVLEEVSLVELVWEVAKVPIC